MKNVYIQGPDGKVRVNIGTLVCYKDGMETWGEVINIQNDTLTIKNGFNNKVVMRTTKDCWDE